MKNLRDRAIEKLIALPNEIEQMSNTELHKLIEELRIHQIELEIQNDELKESRNENEIAREKYFNLFDLAPAAYLVLNKLGIIQELNLKASELFNRGKLYLIGHPFVSLLDTDSMSKFYEYFEYAKNKQSNETFVIRMHGKEQLNYIAVTVSNFPDDKYLLAVMDITKQIEAENAIKESAKQLQDIADNVPVFIARVDKNLNYTFVNKKYELFYGIPSESIINKSIYALLPKKYTKSVEPNIKRVLNGESVQYQSTYETQNNQLHNFDVKLVPHIEQNELVGYFSLVDDITEKKKAEKALIDSELRFRSYINASPLPIFVVNAQGNYTFVNNAACQLVGYDMDELLTLSFNALIFDYNREQGIMAFTEMLKNGFHTTQIDLKHKTGNKVTVILDSVKVTDFEYLGFCTDISQLKKTETALKEKQTQLNLLNDTKNRLLSILAHDLKSPFNGILGFSNLLISNIDNYEKEKIRNFVMQINTQAKSTFTLLENLLDWIRNQTDGINFNPVDTQISEIIFQLIEFYKPLAYIKNLIIRNYITSDILVYADAYMLNTILRNLLSNAIKYSKNGGLISISATITEVGVELKIADNGIGMTEDTRKNLFNNNSQDSVPGTAGEKGTRLGLMLCKDFVEKHHGSIEVTSTLTVGTEFTIKLPNKGN